MKEALFYEKLADNRVRCGLCRHHCQIAAGKRGICAVRENRDGTLVSLVYGKIVAENIDPIEKKPLFHFHPGSRSFSIATVGCNFHCRQCQNYSISQAVSLSRIPGADRTPAEIVRNAVAGGSRSISYTYTEPTIFFEFALDTATAAVDAGLKNVFVTNGYICREPLERIAPLLSAANIDLKGFDAKKYPEYYGARLTEVLDAILEYRRLGIWLELTTLVIPGVNDSEEELKGLASFIREHLGVGTPWHVSRFFPTYRLTDRPPTPVETIARAVEIGREAGLHYVYEGNIPGSGGENTVCSGCGRTIIERSAYRILVNRLKHGNCPGCGAAVAGVWD